MNIDFTPLTDAEIDRCIQLSIDAHALNSWELRLAREVRWSRVEIERLGSLVQRLAYMLSETHEQLIDFVGTTCEEEGCGIPDLLEEAQS